MGEAKTLIQLNEEFKKERKAFFKLNNEDRKKWQKLQKIIIDLKKRMSEATNKSYYEALLSDWRDLTKEQKKILFREQSNERI